MVAYTIYPEQNKELSDSDKKLYSYTNCIGVSLGIILGVLELRFFSKINVNLNMNYLFIFLKFIIIVALLYISFDYNFNPNDSGYGKFKAALQPLIPFLAGISGSSLNLLLDKNFMKKPTYLKFDDNIISDNVIDGIDNE